MGVHHLLSMPQGGLPRRPLLWPPPVALSTGAYASSKRIRRAKLLVCLRQHRHALCAEALQQELRTLYQDQPPGQPPGPPAPLARATLLQASTQGSDDAGIAAMPRERRWHLGLDGLAPETPPCRTG